MFWTGLRMEHTKLLCALENRAVERAPTQFFKTFLFFQMLARSTRGTPVAGMHTEKDLSGRIAALGLKIAQRPESLGICSGLHNVCSRNSWRLCRNLGCTEVQVCGYSLCCSKALSLSPHYIAP